MGRLANRVMLAPANEWIQNVPSEMMGEPWIQLAQEVHSFLPKEPVFIH